MRLAVDVAEQHRPGRRSTLDPTASSTCSRGALRKAFVRDRPDGRLQPGRPAADRGRPGRARGHRSATLQHLELIGDRRVQRGGVIVRTRRRRRRRDARLPARTPARAPCSARRCADAERLRRPLAVYAQRLRRADPYRLNGRVAEVIGLVVESTGPGGRGGGDLPHRRPAAASRVRAEVVGFRDGRTLLMPLGEMHGIRPGDRGRRRPAAPLDGARRRRPARPRARRPRRARSTAAARSDGGGRHVERRVDRRRRRPRRSQRAPIDGAPGPRRARARRRHPLRHAASASASSPAPASASRRCSA